MSGIFEILKSVSPVHHLKKKLTFSKKISFCLFLQISALSAHLC